MSASFHLDGRTFVQFSSKPSFFTNLPRQE